ncbi:MAG: tetratricopeptide repeat protein, partial [Anaerolineae bacterium]
MLPVPGLAYPAEMMTNTAVADGSHPPTTYSAIQLFLQAAQRSAPGFAVDWPAIATICQLVDGLPLGIELAAAWVRALPCSDIAQEIGRNFDFLTAQWRDLPARHRSLRAVFDHSWALLTDAEQAIFRQLAIFRGSFDRAAAAAVTGAGLAQLVTLADKSLLRRLENGRYTIPEALRTFAAAKRRQRPHEQQAVARRHGRYFADLLQQWEPHLKGGRQTETLAAISTDIENMRRAWEWAVQERDTAVLAQSLASLALFYEMRSYFEEGLTAFQQAAQSLKRDAETAVLHARLLAWQGRFSHRLGRYDAARALLEESLAILDDTAQADIAFAANNLGYVAWSQGQYDTAQAHYQRSLTIYRQLNDKWGQSHVLNNLAILPQNLAQTRALLQESRAIAQEIADLWGLARVLNNLGIVTEERQAARQLYRESAAICQQIGDRFLSTFPLTN